MLNKVTDLCFAVMAVSFALMTATMAVTLMYMAASAAVGGGQ